jgi:pyruvate dehydrogenase E1 component beta subunit/2-oxoisovalerate dehydrogenase E1 component
VIIFEHVMLYNLEGEIAGDAGAVDIDKAAIRRPGRDVTLIAYGGTVAKAMAAAAALAKDGIEAEVIDLRSLRPLDTATIVASVNRTRRAVVVDEGWKTGSLSAELTAQIMEHAFWSLDAPVGRVCSVEVPIPYPRHLEQAALPQPEAIVAAARAALGR